MHSAYLPYSNDINSHHFLEFEEDVQFFYPDGIPEELSPVLEEYKANIDKDTEKDPANLIGYLQTMQLAILSGKT